jgi:transposase
LLEEIYRTAQSSIGLPVEQDSEAIAMFRVVLSEMKHLCQLRQQLEHRAAFHLQDNTDFQRLQKVPGIGPILALTILAEAGDMRRFAITASSSSSAASISRPSSRASSAARPSYRNTATRGCAAPSGWPPPSLCARPKTVFETSSNDMSGETPLAQIASVWPMLPLQPKWRA